MNTQFKSVVLILSLVFISACSDTGGVMLDSFEGTIDRKTIDFGSSNDTQINVKADKEIKACGSQSLKVRYDLSKTGYMYMARGYGLDVLGATWEGPDPDKISWDQYGGLSVKVYGSKTGNIAFDVKDSGSELHRFLIKDDFEGWKSIYVPFSSFVAREDWQPGNADNNKIIDFPVKSFQFEPKTPGTGSVYFDCVKLTNG